MGLGMKLYKFVVPPYEPVLYEGLEFEGLMITVLAESVDQAREIAREYSRQERVSDLWLDFTEPQVLDLNTPKVVAWVEI